MGVLSPDRQGDAPSLAPMGLEPGRLWSLWDMLTLWGAEYLQLIHTLFMAEQALRDKRGPLPDDGGLFTRSAADIGRICKKLGLPVSASTAENMLPGKTDAQALHGALTQLTNTLMIEMKDKYYYSPENDYLKYYDKLKLFGDDVFDRFSSANTDVYEAGACLAFERPTAAVMHLMKVLEAGLDALSHDLGVSRQNDWGSYIREIDKELMARMKGAKARTGDEQFYAEAAFSFDCLRRAFRNPTMHP